MSEDPMQHGRDAGTGSRTQQHPLPSYLGGPTGSTGGFPVSSPYQDRSYPPPGFGAPPQQRSPAWGETLVGGAPVQQPKPRRIMPAVIVAALVAGLVGGGGGFVGAYALLDGGRADTGTPSLTTAPATGAAATTPGTVADAAQIATPSTVDIQVRLGQGTAEGSGVVLTADGNVLTNNHVVAGATGTMLVTLADGTEYPATLVGTSPSYDLAVIKLQNATDLVPATFGNSSDLLVGQQVVAIGSPQGLSGTVTTGIVSAFNRTVQVQGDDGSAVVYSGLQTDAPINQGNSGGPLVNLQGQVVGINSAIATAGESSGSIGLGFAIPVDAAKRVAEEILGSGTATKPVLGVRGGTGAPSGAAGAQLASIDPGTPAAAAGLAAGDVVTRVDNVPVQDFADLIARIGSHAPGDTVTLTIADGATGRPVEVTLGSVPDRAATTSSGGQSENPFGGGGQGGGQGGGGSGGGPGEGGGEGGGGEGGGNQGGSTTPFDQDPFGNPFGN